MKKLKKLILEWLFGTDNVKDYLNLLSEHIKLIERLIAELDDHRESLNIIRKLVKICENHSIDVDEEIKHVKLNEVSANETVD